MDLAGIPKRAWRARIIEAYQEVSGNDTIPSNQYMFTLGGPATEDDSELDYYTNRRKFLTKRQYVSVERDVGVHRKNKSIKGPTWLYGDMGRQFEIWYDELPVTKDVAIVSADLMSGIDVALPTIRSILSTMWDNHDDEGAPALLVFNVMQANRWRANQGGTFGDVWETILKDSIVRLCSHRRACRLNLVDRFEYHNKTIGTGQRCSTLSTLMYSFR
jgi:hypothetical protein